jgi:hypothetical protein
MLSPKLLDILRDYWKATRPTEWLFPGDRPGQPITRSAVERVCQETRQRSDITKPVTPHWPLHSAAATIKVAGGQITRSLVDAAPSFTIAHIAEILGKRALEATQFPIARNERARNCRHGASRAYAAGLTVRAEGASRPANLETSSGAPLRSAFPTATLDVRPHSSELARLRQTRKSRRIETRQMTFC